MFLKLYICILFISLINNSYSQFIVKGRVLKSGSEQPIAFASVYLNNTSFGTNTNASGEFIIESVSKGKYELIVSLMGYNALIQPLTVDSNILIHQIVLEPSSNELPEVFVQTYEKDGFEKWGKVFVENFIGTSSNASDCKIVNQESLRFHFNSKSNLLTVNSKDPLIIENRALGYTIRYESLKFEFNTIDHSFYYSGYPFFYEMKTSRLKTNLKWITKRKDAYYGSLMHFMRSLYAKKIEKEKFEIHRIINLTAYEKMRVEQILKSLSDLKHNKENLTIITDKASTNLQIDRSFKDSLLYYRTVKDSSLNSLIVLPINLSWDSIATITNNSTIRFHSNERLKIIYLPKKDLQEFQKYLPRVNSIVSSIIYPTSGKSVLVFNNGNFFDKDLLSFTGFWAWSEKLCNKLPYNYDLIE